jgi:transcriptional antiterminator RfaH
VAGLRARCDEEGHLLQPQALKPGDRAHVLSGPFAQFVATVESLAPQRRVWVLLEILGGETRVWLDAGQLGMRSAPCDERPAPIERASARAVHGGR